MDRRNEERKKFQKRISRRFTERKKSMIILEELVEDIARVCHETNRAFCQTLGDSSQPNWGKAPTWQKESARKGVRFHWNGNKTPEESHQSWFEEKQRNGWKYGPTKNAEKKEHPCMVHYGELPVEQRTKDYLFRAVVHAFKEAITNK